MNGTDDEDPARGVSTVCARCGAAATAVSDTDHGGAAPCPSCGFVLPAAVASELKYLDDLAAWIPKQRAWVLSQESPARRATTAVTVPTGAAGAGATQPAQPKSGTPRVARLILATGVFALVAAGLAFTAYAWSFLGPLGQLGVLVAIGVGSMAGGYAAAAKVPAAATALSITGALLLVVSSGFLLSADSVGARGVRASVVAVLALCGVALAYRLAKRQQAAAVVAALLFAVTALVAVAAAPALRPGQTPSWQGWWVAGTFVVWGAALLVLADRADRLPRLRAPWPWFGTTGLVLGVLVAAGTTADQLDTPGQWRNAPLFWSTLVVIGGCGCLLALDALTRQRWTSTIAASVVLSLGAVVFTLASLAHRSARPWGAVESVVLSLLLLATASQLSRRSARAEAEAEAPPAPTAAQAAVPAAGAKLRRPFPDGIAWVARGLAGAAVGAALALALAPAAEPPRFTFDCTYPCVQPEATAWLASGYPWWRGLLVGVATVVSAAVVAVGLRRVRPDLGPELPTAMGASVIGFWSLIVVSDATYQYADSTVVRTAVMWALLVGGLGLLGIDLATRAPHATVWVAAGIASAGGSVAWSVLGWDDLGVGPELHGLLIAAPLLVAGLALLLKSGRTLPTWEAVGPALAAMLALPVGALLHDVASRMGTDQPPDQAAVLRSVALMAVAVALVVVGVHGRWAAPVWVGTATLVAVTGGELLDVARLVPQWVSLSVVGVALLLVGARWEHVRRGGDRTRAWVAKLH
jgi:hypothetical protein